MKFLFVFVIIFFMIPLICADTELTFPCFGDDETFVPCGFGDDEFGIFFGIGSNVPVDSDGDGIPDDQDTLEGSESDVITSGIANLIITIGGNSTQGTFSGVQEVMFYDGMIVLMEFNHNFSGSKLYLNLVSLAVTSTSIVVNLSGQVNDKILYLDDNSFIDLCVEDAEINSVSDISSGCNEINEIDFTSCLGNSTGIVINNMTCYNLESRLKIESLNYSGIRGGQEVLTPESPSGSGGGRSYQCNDNRDNDFDGLIDYPNDLGCESIYDDNEIDELEPALFDIKVDLKKGELDEKEALILYLDLINKARSGKIDIEIHYTIFDLESNILFDTSETKAVDGVLSYKKTFAELELGSGGYRIFVEIIYGDNQRASADQRFIVTKKGEVIPLRGSSITGFVTNIGENIGESFRKILEENRRLTLAGLILALFIIIVFIIKLDQLSRAKDRKMMNKRIKRN